MVNLGSADWPEKKKKKKKVMTAAHPRTTFQLTITNVSAPEVFTSIYLKLITNYYAHIILIAMLYFDRIIQDLKLTNLSKNMYTCRPTTVPFLYFAQDF